MAGFIPDSLPPVSIFATSPTAPYGGRSYMSANAPVSPISISSPTDMLARPPTRTSGTYSSPFRPPNVHIEDALPHADNMKTSSSPTTISPSPAPRRAPSLRQKPNFRFFDRSSSARVAPSKHTRKRLVKKKLTQPIFEMMNPSEAQRSVAAEDDAAQLGLQLAEAVAAIQQGSTNVKLARASGYVARALDSPVEKEEEVEEYEQRPTKRWSNAPLLPELDFGSSSSQSNHLFDLEALEPPPKATIYISALTDKRSGSADEPNTSKNPSKLNYRCDIHAQNGASHYSVEQACQKVVTDSGGRILNSYFYPGGFLYTLPPNTPEPITSCQLPSLEAKIGMECWMAFSEAKLDGLRLHPPGSGLGSDRPVATSEMERGLKSREKNKLRLVDAWVESDGVAMTVESSSSSIEKVTEKDDRERGCLSLKAAASGDANWTPSRKATLARSLETIRRRASVATRTLEDKSTPSKAAHSPGKSSDNRFTVVLDASDSDSGSGAEEWESVQSEFDGR